jgi:hypothetical protein
MKKGTITKADIANFFEIHEITHSNYVIFEPTHYTVKSYRRDEEGKYVLSKEHPGEPIIDEETFTYAD